MFLKRLFVVIALFLVAFVALIGFSGMIRVSSVQAVKAIPAVKLVTPKELGLGKGACFYDGNSSLSSNKTSCVGVRPPPESKCNPNQSLTDTLQVLHEVRDKIDINGVATLYLFQSDAGGCGSVWAALHVDSGCHVVTDISITDNFNTPAATEGGIDASGVLRCVNNLPWESTFMVDGESGSIATAKVAVDLTPEQTATVLV